MTTPLPSFTGSTAVASNIRTNAIATNVSSVLSRQAVEIIENLQHSSSEVTFGRQDIVLTPIVGGFTLSPSEFQKLGRGNITLGAGAGQNRSNAGGGSIAIGMIAGIEQQSEAITIGPQSGFAQGEKSIAIGTTTGANQGTRSVSVGNNASNGNQGADAIALGSRATNINQGANAIAIGAINTGDNSINQLIVSLSMLLELGKLLQQLVVQ